MRLPSGARRGSPIALNRRNCSLSGKWRLEPFAGDAGVCALSTTAGKKNSTRRALETKRVMQEEYQEEKKEARSMVLLQTLSKTRLRSKINTSLNEGSYGSRRRRLKAVISHPSQKTRRMGHPQFC